MLGYGPNSLPAAWGGACGDSGRPIAAERRQLQRARRVGDAVVILRMPGTAACGVNDNRLAGCLRLREECWFDITVRDPSRCHRRRMAPCFLGPRRLTGGASAATMATGRREWSASNALGRRLHVFGIVHGSRRGSARRSPKMAKPRKARAEAGPAAQSQVLHARPQKGSADFWRQWGVLRFILIISFRLALVTRSARGA